MRAFFRRFLMHYGIYRRYPLGVVPPCVMRGAPLSPDPKDRVRGIVALRSHWRDRRLEPDMQS